MLRNLVFGHMGFAFMLMKYNRLLKMFTKIIGIYDCSLPWCFFRPCVRDFLIWKMCSFTKPKEGYIYQIKSEEMSCNTSHIVYLINCKTCGIQYVGSATTPFRLRFNNYKSTVLLPTPLKHFTQNDHKGFSRLSRLSRFSTLKSRPTHPLAVSVTTNLDLISM